MAENNDNKKKELALKDGLSEFEKTMLSQVIHHGGHKVIIRLANAICADATADIVKLDPEKPDYEKKLIVRGQRSRNFREAFSLLFGSIDGHVENVRVEEAQENASAEDDVAKVYGWSHPVPPKSQK